MRRRTATATVNLLVFTVLSMALLIGAVSLASLVEREAQDLQQKLQNDLYPPPHITAEVHARPQEFPSRQEWLSRQPTDRDHRAGVLDN